MEEEGVPTSDCKMSLLHDLPVKQKDIFFWSGLEQSLNVA